MHVWGQPQLCGHQVVLVLPLREGESGGHAPAGCMGATALLLTSPPPPLQCCSIGSTSQAWWSRGTCTRGCGSSAAWQRGTSTPTSWGKLRRRAHRRSPLHRSFAPLLRANHPRFLRRKQRRPCRPCRRRRSPHRRHPAAAAGAARRSYTLPASLCPSCAPWRIC